MKEKEKEEETKKETLGMRIMLAVCPQLRMRDGVDQTGVFEYKLKADAPWVNIFTLLGESESGY